MIKPEEAAGKVFNKLIFSKVYPRVLVLFKDKTFFMLEARHSRDCDVEINIDEFNLDKFEHYTLVEEGIYNKETIEEYESKKKIKRECFDKELRRLTYEKLKKEFEPK